MFAPPHESQALPEPSPGQGEGDDAEGPEVEEDQAGEIEGADEEEGDGDEDQGGHRAGPRDVPDLGQARAEAPWPVEAEGLEDQRPYDGDGRGEVGIGLPRRGLPGQRDGKSREP